MRNEQLKIKKAKVSSHEKVVKSKRRMEEWKKIRR